MALQPYRNTRGLRRWRGVAVVPLAAAGVVLAVALAWPFAGGAASADPPVTDPPVSGHPANVAAATVAPANVAPADVAPANVTPVNVTSAPAAPAAPRTALDLPVSAVNLRRTVTVQVVQKTKDAVVNISALKLFSQPFDFGQVVRLPGNSLGSGFVVHRDGYVVTNNHVVDRARQITVELADGRKLVADLISADPDADLAVLRIHSPTPLPTLEMGDSSDLMIGEPVIAVGNPLGYSHSVSTGIVSALHRDVAFRRPGPAAAAKADGSVLRDLIQTDAAINPGNSGGPLLNAYGQVIAINTAVRGDAQNIGFAIPIDRLRDLIPELMNPSQVTKVDVPVKLAERRTVAEPATVTSTVVAAPGSIGAGTVLEAVDGVRPANVVDAYAMLLTLKPNQSVALTWAGGRTQRVMTRPTPIPDAVVQARQRFGLHVEQVTPMLANKYHLATEVGLFVTAVDANTAAARAAIQPGDIILGFGSVPLSTLDDFGALVPRLPEAGEASVVDVRGQELRYLPMKF